jgi:hypothetical protein
LEPFQPEPSEEMPEAPDMPEEPADPDEPQDEEKIVVNPDDVPMEIVKPQGDGVQMDLFNELNDETTNK